MFYTCLPVGFMQVNCYILADESTKEAVVIDPGEDAQRIMSVLNEHEFQLTRILLTHGHFDHIGAIKELKQHWENALVCIHESDAPMLLHPEMNLSFMNPEPVTALPADCLLRDGDTIPLGNETLQVIHTPGHSAGGVCFHMGNLLFSGDTLFMESIGRFDFGSYSDILDSLEHLMQLPDDVVVLPGHGPKTSIGHERTHNPYVGG